MMAVLHKGGTMHRKVLLIMVVSTILLFAASAEKTCIWEGWWHNDSSGNIHFQSTSSGQTTATYDGYGKYPAGIFEGSIMDNGDGKPCVFKGTWQETERLSPISQGNEMFPESGRVLS